MRISIFSVTVTSLCLLSLVSGCLYEIRDEIVDCEISMRNHLRACDAWCRSLPVDKSKETYGDFKSGFLQGYKAIATGGNGCPPVLPPACYWKGRYQSEEGQAKTNAWFDGYSQGALAAKADGVAELNRIVTRGGRHDDGHQIGRPAIDHETPTEMTPAEAAKESARNNFRSQSRETSVRTVTSPATSGNHSE